MKRALITFALSFALLAACREEPELPAEDANALARAVMDSALASIGGRDVLDAVVTLAIQYGYTRWDLTSSVDTAPIVEVTDAMIVRDYVNGRTLYEVQGTQAAQAVWERAVIAPEGSWVHDFSTATTRELDTGPALADYASVQLQWYVYQAFGEALLFGSALRYHADTTIGAARHHDIRYVNENDQNIRLLLNAADFRIASLTIAVFDPNAGRRTLRYEFDDYREVGGLPVPFQVTVFSDGRRAARYDVADVRFNGRIIESAFQPPGA